MSLKIKTHILTGCWLLLGLLAFTVRPAGAEETLAAFSGNHELREAIWRLGAFVPAAPAGQTSRSITIDGVRDLPPVTIILNYDEPLNPWPGSLSLRFVAEASEPPAYITIEDQRPFGGPNLKISGRKDLGERGREEPARIYLDLLERLNDRLLKSRPRLGRLNWQESCPGFEAARTELLYGARFGPPDLFLARFDPARFSFRPYHESEFGGQDAVNINGWAGRLPAAAAIINSGQYYPDRAYMGLLARDGRSLSAGAHSQWKGVVAAGPGPEAPAGTPAAAVIDLQDQQEPRRPEHYLNLMQSFMLLDRRGNIRVRNSHSLAGRAAVGEDREGRIVLIMTPAAISLYDLALALKDPRLGLVRVAGLDGGFEAQLLLRQNGTPFMAGGQFSISPSRSVYVPGYHPTLPAVLAVEIRADGEGGPDEPAARDDSSARPLDD
ncbi:phosphodiester glycosidase family protein [Deltaproteobacteria bacterium OttesenSCG-928-M10]|nr:phosphodiester glycosidase family protein [Deltaproteobacteria bacterium OttesenSCG-928-M10]